MFLWHKMSLIFLSSYKTHTHTKQVILFLLCCYVTVALLKNHFFVEKYNYLNLCKTNIIWVKVCLFIIKYRLSFWTIFRAHTHTLNKWFYFYFAVTWRLLFFKINIINFFLILSLPTTNISTCSFFKSRNKQI